MNQQTQLSQLKHLMSQDNWKISQHFEINTINEKEVSGIAVVTAVRNNIRVNYNEGFLFNRITKEIEVTKENLYGVWWIESLPDVNEIDVIDEENEIIDSFDLDEQNFPSKFSQVDYSKIISNYFVIDNFSLNDD